MGITAIGLVRPLAEAHDRALAELPFDLRERGPSAFSRSVPAMASTPEFAVFVGVRLFTLTR